MVSSANGKVDRRKRDRVKVELPKELQSVQLNEDDFNIQQPAQKYEKEVQDKKKSKTNSKNKQSKLPQSQQLSQQKKQLKGKQPQRQKYDDYEDEDDEADEDQYDNFSDQENQSDQQFDKRYSSLKQIGPGWQIDNDEFGGSENNQPDPQFNKINEGQQISIPYNNDEFGGNQHTQTGSQNQINQQMVPQSTLQVKDLKKSLEMQSKRRKANIPKKASATATATEKKSKTLTRSRVGTEKRSSTPPKKKSIKKEKSQKLTLQKGESIKTSYNVSHQSFKWISKARSQILTVKKGAQKHISKLLFEIELKKQASSSNNSGLSKSTKTINTDLLKKYISELASVTDFSSNMQNFLTSYEDMQLQNRESEYFFSFYSQLDRGSFGEVDLYFCQSQQDISIGQEETNNVNLMDTEEDIDQRAIKESLSSSFSTVTSSISYQLRSNKRQEKQMMSLKVEKPESSLKSNRMVKRQQFDIEKQITLDQIGQRKLVQSSQITPIQEQKQRMSYVPVAGKKFNSKDEFIRELYIMNIVNSDYMPKLLGHDIDNQIIYLQLGLCNLYELKLDSQQKGYKLSDDFIYSILINIINAVDQLLNNYNAKEQKHQPIFHSDIKPQNIILTVNQSKVDLQPEVKLLLIDYGGASYDLADYWTYYTPAFVYPGLWDRVVEGTQKKSKLNWQEIRFAEIYAACRTVQYLMLDSAHEGYFKKENYSLFISEYLNDYPKTCRVLEIVNGLSSCQIDAEYTEILKSLNVNQTEFMNQRINFDFDKLYEISKFYQIISSTNAD